MRTRGFTIIEVLIATIILTVVVGIVYASYSSVVNSISGSRVVAEELRLRQYLERSFNLNFSTAYTDQNTEDEVFQFIGVDEDGAEGPRDSVRFCSTAPLLGGTGMPGDIKEVRYEILDEGPSELALDMDEEEAKAEGGAQPSHGTLQCAETPLMAGMVEELEGDLDQAAFVPEAGYEPPVWSVPIASMDIQYFDGTDWLPEWDSVEYGRLPWCVLIRINFAKTDEQKQEDMAAGFDREDDPDFEAVVPVYAGLGLLDDTRLLTEAGTVADGDQAETDEGGSNNGTSNDGDAEPSSDGAFGDRR